VKKLAASKLLVGLYDPGLTPMLRAGLGGLAAAAHALNTGALGHTGTITVEPHAIVLDWFKPGSAAPFLERLFAACFRINDGLIDLAGSHEQDQPLEVRVAMSDALRLTFLQHGSSALKKGPASARTLEIDDQPRQLLVQSYSGFVHQMAWESIAKVLDKAPGQPNTVTLAGWANPGAIERHVGLGCTNIAYTPAEALCACFALIGCLSYQGPSRSGILLVLEPADLIRFAEARPRLAPRTLQECMVASPGDGVLTIHAALQTEPMRQLADGIASISAMTLRSTSWASQQKSRTDTMMSNRYEDTVLEAFRRLVLRCPTRMIATKGAKAGEPGGYWGFPSSLRGFVADNVARHRAFYAGFTTAKTRDDPPRWLHRFRSADDDLGALRFPDDQKGLIAMTDTLNEAERRLVAAIHTALRQRFSAIADENSGNGSAFKNRGQSEHDRWRLCFAGARTHEQVRHALADLWSRAGTIHELQGDGWQSLQPLLRSDAWEAARDLALIALASYQGRGSNDTTSTTTA
jgi:CRISPR-associated protein Cas8a1/Csx13